MLVDIFAVREHLDELRSGVDEVSNLVTSRPISVGISTPLDQLQGIVGDTRTWPPYLELFDRPVAVRKATLAGWVEVLASAELAGSTPTVHQPERHQRQTEHRHQNCSSSHTDHCHDHPA